VAIINAPATGFLTDTPQVSPFDLFRKGGWSFSPPQPAFPKNPHLRRVQRIL